MKLSCSLDEAPQIVAWVVRLERKIGSVGASRLVGSILVLPLANIVVKFDMACTIKL